MKLLFAVVQNEDVKPLTRALVRSSINVTRISSSGGFLSGGNSTLMIGVEDVLLRTTLEIIKEHSNRRTAPVAASVLPVSQGIDAALSTTAPSIDVTIGGATVFVVNAEEFYKF